MSTETQFVTATIDGHECVGLPSREALKYKYTLGEDKHMCEPCPNHAASGCSKSLLNASCMEVNGAPYNLVWFKERHFIKFTQLKLEGKL